jgi:hypothetical protein
MPYTHTTYGDLKTQLSLRLDDPSKIFWVDAELGIYVTEALRTFGLCSAFWRERGTFTTTPSTAYYDIYQLLTNGVSLILQPTVTDRDIIQAVQYYLLESTAAASQTVWLGTEMFNYQDVANAIQNRLNQFLSDTGCVVTRTLVPVASPPIGRQQLDQSIIDVRHASWLGVFPSAYYNTLWREDERLLTAADQTWSVNSGTPECYSIMAPPPLQLQLSPPPVASGQLELLTVNSKTLDPANVATILGIPDDLTPAIKWGALADLLGMDGIAMDPVRADYCEQRYQAYVTLARLLPVVVHAEINGVPLISSTLQEIEALTPAWENITGTPSDIALAAPNMVALSSVPDAVYSVTLDVVRKSPIPASDIMYVQLGREQLDMIVDYAEHLALFKVHGVEWHATERQANNFLLQSLTYNQRLAAAARAAFSASQQSERQKQSIPRRLDNTMGLGALRINPQQPARVGLGGIVRGRN